ncbi:RidA family protein [Halomonas sp. PA16-9]|uniref:RidA family protein n=1 Tax=Halomonas sp. PA16-9 TaxID=2576841 RepID=UPI0030EF06B3
MSIKRYGVNESKGSGRQALPFAKATEADGWLYVSGQTPMVEGEVIDGGIVPQAHQAISNMISIVEAAGYSVADIMRVGVWLDDPRDFWSFNKIFAQYFGDHPRPEPVFNPQWSSTARSKLTALPFARRPDQNALQRAHPTKKWPVPE